MAGAAISVCCLKRFVAPALQMVGVFLKPAAAAEALHLHVLSYWLHQWNCIIVKQFRSFFFFSQSALSAPARSGQILSLGDSCMDSAVSH